MVKPDCNSGIFFINLFHLKKYLLKDKIYCHVSKDNYCFSFLIFL